MKTIRRNAHRKIAAIRESIVWGEVYSDVHDFESRPILNMEYVWNQYGQHDFQRLVDKEDGTYVIEVHSNLWYKLHTRPLPAPPAEETPQPAVADEPVIETVQADEMAKPFRVAYVCEASIDEYGVIDNGTGQWVEKQLSLDTANQRAAELNRAFAEESPAPTIPAVSTPPACTVWAVEMEPTIGLLGIWATPELAKAAAEKYARHELDWYAAHGGEFRAVDNCMRLKDSPVWSVVPHIVRDTVTQEG